MMEEGGGRKTTWVPKSGARAPQRAWPPPRTPPITCGCSSATAGPANSRSLHNMWLLERHSGPGQLPQPPITYAPRHASTRARHHRCVRFRKTKQHFASVIWASRGKSSGLLKWGFDPRLPAARYVHGAAAAHESKL